MKICMVSRVYPPKIGGTGSMLKNVSERLVNDGFDVKIVTQKFSETKKHEIINGVEIFRTSILTESNEFNPLNLGFGSLTMASKIFNLRNCDVFHSHDISVAGFSTWLSKKMINKKLFVLKYGGDLVFEYLSLKNFKNWNPKNGLEETLKFNDGLAGVLHKLQNSYFKNYDFILPDSFYGENFLIDGYFVSPNKIKTIRNGVDIDIFKPMDKTKSRKKFLLPEDKKIIVSASRLVEWKGIDVLIKAFSEVVKKIPNSLLVIAGSGPEKQKLISLVNKLNLDKKIIFYGNISREQMPFFLNAADIFVLPSYFDTAPNALLEAMSCGAACIISDIDGMTEVTNTSAEKVLPGDEKELTEKLLLLLEDEDKQKILEKKARKKIVDEYSLKIAFRNYLNFYNSLSGNL